MENPPQPPMFCMLLRKYLIGARITALEQPLGERLLISNNMVRHDELDFLDDITLEQASAALGVPIYPVDADGFALCDAMFGILPEVHLPDRGSGSTDGAEYYKYNPHKEG